MSELMWHYLPEKAIKETIQQEILQVPILKRESDEKHPCLWFTPNDLSNIEGSMLKGQGYLQIWDRTRPSEVKLSKVYRIGIKPNSFLLNWEEYCKIELEDQRLARRIAGELFCGLETDHWYCSIHELTKHYWVSIQVLEDGIWLDFESASQLNP